MEDYHAQTVGSIRSGLLEKRFSARELAEEALRTAGEGNEISGAFLSFTPERAFRAADRNRRQHSGRRGDRPAGGRSACRQGRDPDGGREDDLRLASAAELHRPVRRYSRAASGKGTGP